ncbi:MAG: hypothetical protein INR62_11490, partial [Rhodospirillales bacterium]|nr:hypothetical protein [Acetobacter sp.]
MKTFIAASALATLAAASPQGPPGYRGQDWSSGAGPWGSMSSGAWSAVQSALASWTSAASVTAWPTASSEWASFTSDHPVPSELSSAASWWSSNGFPQVTGAPGG